MKNIKPGDRVSFEYYSSGKVEIRKGVFKRIIDDGQAEIKNGTMTYYVYPKSMRKLVKKERRRIWVRKNLFPLASFTIENTRLGVTMVNRMNDPNWVEFIEVRNKK